VNEQTEELPKGAWRDTLDRLTETHSGEPVTIEVVGQLGDQIEAEQVHLVYVEYDNKDDVAIVAVREPDREDPVLRHVIEHPQRVFVHPGAPEPAQAVDVMAVDGTQTLITFER
jgi:hypothetical protein